MAFRVVSGLHVLDGPVLHRETDRLVEPALVEGIDVYPVDTLARLATHFRDYHPIEPYRTVFDLDADPPAYAADFMDING
jgi:hypothetical protein